VRHLCKILVWARRMKIRGKNVRKQTFLTKSENCGKCREREFLAYVVFEPAKENQYGSLKISFTSLAL